MNSGERRSNELSYQAEPNQRQKNAIRKLKMMAVLPLLVLPFVTLGFYALGGGKGKQPASKNTVSKEGLNFDLPSANFKKDAKEDKLSFYEKMRKGDKKDGEIIAEDSTYQMRDSQTDMRLNDFVASKGTQYDPSPKDPYSGLSVSPTRQLRKNDQTESRINERLAQLQMEINKPQTSPNDLPVGQLNNQGAGADVDKLEGLMQMMQDKKSDDPEMKQIEGMLEKILDIQHPDRVNDKIREKSLLKKEQVFPVMRPTALSTTSLLTTDTSKIRRPVSGFFGLKDKNLSTIDNGVEAVIQQTQTLVSGATIELQLSSDIYIHGMLVPKGSSVYGIASISNERLTIPINSIKMGNSMFPVKLDVYDLDGLKGIRIPGAITRDVMKQSADDGIQQMELQSINPSIGAQAAVAGITTAKTLLSRKVKLIKVTVKAGYKVLLWSQINAEN